MKNCLIAQSGGPTAVINSSVIGILEENNLQKYFHKVYAAVNGIEGVLKRKIINLSTFDKKESDTFKHTPSSGLGSCRYKLKNISESIDEYSSIFQIFQEYNIDTFFYIGGNDSMDTVAKLNEYAKLNSINTKILGVPKTIDNDLMYTDHTPGYGSAAKLISTLTLETYLDSSVYSNNGIFIIETMGRDTGWLAASATLAKIKDKPVADLIYLPERAFDIENFLVDVEKKYKEQNQVYIVASEGLKNKEGRFLSELSLESEYDNFGHVQLGGVCSYLKDSIKKNKITSRVKALELGVIQRCGMHIASKVDIDEAFNAGKAALNYAIKGESGYMIGIRRIDSTQYTTENFLIKASDVCNNIKYFPLEWINEDGNGITKEGFDYINPLIQGNPNLNYENGLPSYIKI
jgi:6-phosphofructokinase